jgi:hypothetical protein
MAMDQDSVKLGLLIEGAQAHQKLAEAAIDTLHKTTQGLEEVMRDQIQRALVDGLQRVRVETKCAVETLQRIKRAANARTAISMLVVTAATSAIALLVAWWVLPNRTEIAALRDERDQLARNVAVLNQRGGRANLRRCGTRHLCVRVDLKAPRYGDGDDYLVIKGY